MKSFSADFETTVDIDDCRVWAWALCDIDNTDDIIYGNDMESFMQRLLSEKDSVIYYFHNLKFDGEFILCWLLKNGWKHTTEKKLYDHEFSTLISDRGVFYSIEIFLRMKGKNAIKVKILDSMKVLPFSVDTVAKAFDLEDQKLVIDYKERREPGHELTIEEKNYIRNDVVIVAKALNILHSQGLNKMTTGSNAMANYKDIIGKKNFTRWFPSPEYDADVRQAYKGGFTYLSPRYARKEVGRGIVLDVNSLYPSVMYYNKLPYGEGIFFEGKYENDELYDLYVQMITCQFELKPDHIPTIQLKNTLAFVPTEYLTSSGGELVTMCLTSVDLELFFEHYDVYDITYHNGWKFKSHVGLFKDYIDKWNKVKVDSTISKNYAMRTLAKLMLNSLYGKFATNPNVQSKIPYLDDGVVRYRLGEEEKRNPVYIPVGCFITAWARYKTITSAQKVYNRFIYADTDSLHLEGTEIPEGLEISDTKLGAWKHESTFEKARFIRQKSYVEVIDGKLKITCAGMPSSCYDHVTFENFNVGLSVPGKLQTKHVRGGIVLVDGCHTLKE